MGIWANWGTRLNLLPEILVGPILRDVGKFSASVFLVMRAPYTCTLRVYDGSTVVLKGTATTISLAPTINVVLITANVVPPSVGLSAGKIYEYDVFFQGGVLGAEVPESGSRLRTAGFLNKGAIGVSLEQMTYIGHPGPTFALPPANLSDLRIIHGSCRKAHGGGTDALPSMDGLIETTSHDPNHRPHLLLLTGDQIYADDVAAPLLGMLTETGIAVGFLVEKAIDGSDVPKATRRAEFVRSHGITSDEAVARSHLVTFAEYAMMYVFAWSNVFWQGTDTYPTYHDATGYPQPGRALRQSIYGLQSQALDRYQAGLPKVRRLLANVPTYMQFDDHEITDDWFLDREWVTNSATKPQLKRIVQNGLGAYAVFQAWGNRPSEMEATVNVVRAWVSTPNATTEGVA
jgi:hypothetical protein